MPKPLKKKGTLGKLLVNVLDQKRTFFYSPFSLRPSTFRLAIVALFLALCISTPAWSAPSKYLNYQGKLTDSAGKNVTGTHKLTFRIYDASTSGTKVWEESQNVAVSSGIFTAILGKSTAFDLTFNKDFWLTLDVDDTGELSPRQQLVSTPYAINSTFLEGVGGSSYLRSDEADTMEKDLTLKGTLTFSGVSTDITTGSNEDLTINPSGSGSVVLNIDSATTGFKVTDGTTDWFIVDDAGNATFTSDTGTDLFNIKVGNLKVGDGTPGQTLDGEDAYVEGILEVDGRIYADGGISGTIDSSATITHSLDAAYDDGSTITVDTGAITLNDSITSTTNALAITNTGVVSGTTSRDVMNITSSATHTTTGTVALLGMDFTGTVSSGTPEGINIQMPAATNNAINTNAIVRAATLTSTASTGTAPLTVSSTTVVTNLNADLLDGTDSSSFDTDASNDLTTSTSWGGDLTGTGSSPQIGSAVIVNADISTTADIAKSKISTTGTWAAADLPSDGYASTFVNVSGDTMTGDLGMGNSLLLNVGAAGTDFTSGGGLTIGGTAVFTANPTIAPAVDASGSILDTSGTLTEAASGTHARLVGLNVTAPTITAGAGAVTNTASIYVSGAPSATGATNYALWVDGGNVRLDGDLDVQGTSLTATSATTVTLGSTGNDTIVIGNTAGSDTITIGNSSATGVSITDDNWSVTTAGAGTFASGTFNGNVDMTSDLLLNIGDASTDFTSGGGLSLAGTAVLSANPTISPSASANGSITDISGTLVEAGSGTHARLVGLNITAPSVTAGAGAVTDASSFYISGTPSASGATNYALWVDGGTSRFDGNIRMDGSTSGAITIAVPATVTSHTLTWPSAVGGASTFLQTDTSGNLSWVAQSTDAPTSAEYVTYASNTSLSAERILTVSGTDTLGADLSLANNLILNVGNASTDFTSGGGLTIGGLAALSVTANIPQPSLNTSPAVSVNPTVNAKAAYNANVVEISGTIVEDSVSNHPLIAGLNITAPSVTAGLAAVTEAASLYISDAPAASGASNYALFVDAGASRFDGNVDLNSTGLFLNIGDASTDFTSGGGLTIGGTAVLTANPTISPAASANGSITDVSGTLVEAGSGTHARLVGLNITAPTVTAGLASVTDTSSLYISAAPSASGATNYALWVDAGDARFDGNIGIGDSTPDGLLDVEPTGAVTVSSYGINLSNLTTNTTTDAINKYGAYITSTGSWTGSTGTATNNYGLYIDTVSGGDNNYGLYVVDNVGFGGTSSTGEMVLRRASTQVDLINASDAGQYAVYWLYSGTSARWSIYKWNTAESGSDAGSNFGIARYNDSGSALEDILFIRRSDGQIGIGTTNPGVRFDLRQDTASSAMNTVQALYQTNSGGAGAANIGSRIAFGGETATEGTVAVAAAVGGLLTTATAGSEDGALAIYTRSAGGSFTERVRIDATGQMIRYGTTSGSITFAVPATITSHTLTWPSAQGGDEYYLKNDGAGGLTWSSPATVVRKATTESLASSTVLQNDDELLIAIGASETWQIEGFLDMFNASATPDIKIAFTVPTGATMNIAYHAGGGTTTSFILDLLTGSGTAGAAIPLGASVVNPLFFKGIVVNSTTAGNIQLQWAQNTSNANATQVRANSYIKGTRL